jgi:hypothetical protein
MVMAPTLGWCGDGCFSETALFRAPLAPAPARPGQHHRLAGRHDTQLVVVAGALRGRRLADELGEPGGKGAEQFWRSAGHGATPSMTVMDIAIHQTLSMSRLAVRLDTTVHTGSI